MNAPFQPPSRAQNMSPVSVGSGSEWSGMNNYNIHNKRSDHQYNGPVGYSDNSVTPPDSATFNGPPARPFGPPGMEKSQRRDPSETGSQQSSRAASVANSRSSDGTISDQHSKRYRRMEVELQQHYTVLKNFLKGGAPQPPRPNKARDKLLRLSPVQFHELSTDVFDELQRRQAGTPLPGRPPRRDNVPPFLQPRSDFHEKRNQARQKLSSLQTARFRDLSTDVFCELERRFPLFNVPEGGRRDSFRSISSRGARPPPRVHTSNPSVASSNGFPLRNGSMPGGNPYFDNTQYSNGSPVSEFGRPVPKQFQSNTITPNKSTMIEDEEDYDYENSRPSRNNRSSDAFGLESAIASPSSDRDTSATSVSTSNRDIKNMQDKLADMENILSERDESIQDLGRKLQQKVDDAQNLERSLQQEIERLRFDHANRERDLQAEMLAAKRNTAEDGSWKSKHEQLQYDHKDLQERFKEQQKITDEVSQQGQMFLREMRAMAEEGIGGDVDREERLQLTVSRLEEEVKEWKTRYAKAKSQQRNTRTNSLGPGIQPPHVVQNTNNQMYHHPDGMITQLHITQFQIAVDELLQAARTQEPTSLMDYMKSLVVAVRKLALDVDQSKPPSQDEESMNKRMKLKSRVSATANNVITACKTFAASGGISPVSLLDAAAAHLSAAVVDLARVVKICSTRVGESEVEQVDGDEVELQLKGTPDPVNESGYFSMSQRLRSTSQADSVYSALSTPQADEIETGSNSNQQQMTPRPGYEPHGVQSTGLGIQAGLSLKEDDTELQELKIYLENKTDLLVQTIQSLVGSIRNEEAMTAVHGHISGILDVVENVLSAAEGAMEDPSWYQQELKEQVAGTVDLLAASKEKLVAAGNDPKAQVDGPSSKTFTQRLPPLAFRIARETKELVARIDSVEAGKRGDEEDFS